MKRFEISIRNRLSETIAVRDSDTPIEWWRRNVTNNRRGKVTLHLTSYPTSDLLNIEEVEPRKRSKTG